MVAATGLIIDVLIHCFLLVCQLTHANGDHYSARPKSDVYCSPSPSRLTHQHVHFRLHRVFGCQKLLASLSGVRPPTSSAV
ncbi:hypothetical protein EDB86DRAFT_2944317 [Lactarius hatsudake]|nr:hypothetical protein EDB86DRAFT_2944317 [Lactarius hatsudake]